MISLKHMCAVLNWRLIGDGHSTCSLNIDTPWL